MKYFNFNLIVAFLMGASVSLAALDLANDTIQGPAGNYAIVDIKWQVLISPGRTDTVVGTIEDVVRHLAVVAPDILKANNISLPGAEPTDVLVPLEDPLVKTPKPSSTKCDIFQSGGKMLQFYNGIRYLNGLGNEAGKPGNGPQSCGQVSCSWNSAIWWCNENSNSLTLDSWPMVGDGALAVMHACTVHLDGTLNGQSFYDDGWSVMLKRGSC